MGGVLLDMVVSLDGFIAGPNDEDAGLHNWYFAPAAESVPVLDELEQTIGAMILGRRTYDMGAAQSGFADTPYRVPHFVLSNTVPVASTAGSIEFMFIEAGIEQALQQAQAAAGDKKVCIAGGAHTAQQYLRAGLIDELQLHSVPILLGNGIRLFDDPDFKLTQLESTRVLTTPAVTHMYYKVLH